MQASVPQDLMNLLACSFFSVAPCKPLMPVNESEHYSSFVLSDEGWVRKSREKIFEGFWSWRRNVPLTPRYWMSCLYLQCGLLYIKFSARMYEFSSALSLVPYSRNSIFFLCRYLDLIYCTLYLPICTLLPSWYCKFWR